ncbi:MAG: DUF488 domain-containing protein [Syntrophotalea acetylenica]|nr:DUF488 domain-containing protein [Syntrophotalea acetylenica]
MGSPIYTIGYAPHNLGSFIVLLKQIGITAIADVRSQPYSRYKPEFNREVLGRALRVSGIQYVFLGEEIGARPSDQACYEHGRVSFDRLAETPLFKQGIKRLQKGRESHSIALMCAEKDPITCHRMVLVSKVLQEDGIEVLHILEDGALEPNRESEIRLVAKLGLTADLFRTEEQGIAQAYAEQARALAFEKFPEQSEEDDRPRMG